MEHNNTNPVFVKDVDRILDEHFRYWTMSSWNCLESYAHNVKLHKLGLTSEQLDRAFELLDEDVDTSAFWDGVHELITDFYEETGYMAGFNGRSGGYLVLYDTVRRDGMVSALSTGIVASCSDKTKDAPRMRGVIREWRKYLTILSLSTTAIIPRKARGCQ